MPFEFKSPPLKLAFVLYTAFSTLFIRLPFWLISSAVPSWRPRSSWPASRVVIVSIFRTAIHLAFKTEPPKPEHNPSLVTAKDNSLNYVSIEANDALVIGQIKEFAEKNSVKAEATGGYWHVSKDLHGAHDQKALPGEKVILHLHGGGFITGSAHPKNALTTPICAGLIEHIDTVSRVFSLEYRISSAKPFTPANPFPAALIDAVHGYDYLINSLGFAPSDIIVAGDSAGGNLAISLVRYLALISSASSKESGIAFPTPLPVPLGLLALSPTVEWGLTHTGPDSSMTKNDKSDYCQGFFCGYTATALLGSLPSDEAFTNPWISPASQKLPQPITGLFSGFPSTCIVAGEAEIALDSMRTFKDRVVSDNGEEKVCYVETFGATHDFLGLTWCEPERTEALKAIGAWVKAL